MTTTPAEIVGNEAFGYVDPTKPIDVTLGFGSFKVIFEKAYLVDVNDDTMTFDALLNGRWRRLSVDHPYDPDREPYRAEVTFIGDSVRELPIPPGTRT